jgi:hypothetical protein
MKPQEVNWLYLFVGAIVAGVVTLVANLIIEVVRSRRTEKSVRHNFELLLRLELESALKSLGELRSSLEDRSQYLYRWILILEKNVATLDKARNKAYLLRNRDLQVDYASFTTDLSLFTSDVRVVEDLAQKFQNDEAATAALKKENQDFINQKRLEKLTELMDLKRRAEDLIRRLDPQK